MDTAPRPAPAFAPGADRAAVRPTGILARLRAETRPQHDALERVVDLLDPALTLERYRRWLHVLHGFHAPVERAICAVPGWSALGLDPVERRRLAWLETDLASLGEARAGAFGECAAVPVPRTLSEALGALYVLEGSTLGGRVIVRHLEATLGLGPLRGARFFAGHGERTGAMWAGCRHALERHAEGGGDVDAVVEGAAGTFAALGRWIEGCGR